MKRFVIGMLALIGIFSLSGCGSVGQIENETETVVIGTTAYQIDKSQSTSDTEDNVESSPVNYMDEIKQEIHDELFRDETEVTKDIVERIFKHLEVETIDAFVDGDEAVVLMSVTTVNAGQAWINGLEKYAVACAENLFSETYIDDATLYECYLEEFENAVRAANYIKIPVAVEMDYENHRWIWDIDDDVINAITGFMLAAIDGDINSATPFTLAWLDDDITDNFDIKIELDPEVPWSFIF